MYTTKSKPLRILMIPQYTFVQITVIKACIHTVFYQLTYNNLKDLNYCLQKSNVLSWLTQPENDGV